MEVAYRSHNQTWKGKQPSQRNSYPVKYTGETDGQADSNGVIVVRVTRVKYLSGSELNNTDFMDRVNISRVKVKCANCWEMIDPGLEGGELLDLCPDCQESFRQMDAYEDQQLADLEAKKLEYLYGGMIEV